MSNLHKKIGQITRVVTKLISRSISHQVIYLIHEKGQMISFVIPGYKFMNTRLCLSNFIGSDGIGGHDLIVSPQFLKEFVQKLRDAEEINHFDILLNEETDRSLRLIFKHNENSFSFSFVGSDPRFKYSCELDQSIFVEFRSEISAFYDQML